MDTWSYGERVCLLCERPAYPTDYYAPNFEGSEPTAIIPLCQYHKASYMGHGLKKLDEMYRKGEIVATTEERSEILLEWAREQGLSEDPDRISKLYAEARRRWVHLTTRHGITKILEATLEKI